MNATPQFHLVLAYKKKKAVKEGKAKIVICVLSASDSERWEQMCSEADKKLNTLALQECFSKQWRKYRRIGWNEERYDAKTKAEAYRIAYAWQKELANQKRPSEIHGDGAQNKHKIYAFEMSPEVWLDKKFESENEHIQKEQQSKTIAFYVGQTSKSIEERYLAHISDPKTSSKWGKKFFKSPFSNAFKPLNKQLIQKYFEDHALPIGEPLSYGMSIIHEEQFTAFLREEGYAAYSR